MKTDVMGIVNVTPDSFSDGGRYFKPEEALRRAANVVGEGARFVDFGAESTRPGAAPISADEEWSRLELILKPFVSSAGSDIIVSVDTYHSETAARALDCGVRLINCVKREPLPEMLQLLARYPNVELVVPHRGEPLSPELKEVLPRLYLDPMVGFDTTREEDLALVKGVATQVRMGRVLVGVSRKRLVKKLTGEKVVGKNLGGNLALAMWCAQQGASVVRVHDVCETVQALKVLATLR